MKEEMHAFSAQLKSPEFMQAASAFMQRKKA